MFFLYQVFLSILILISPFLIIYRIYINKEHKIRFKEKLSFSSKKRNKGKLIWFHGASVGEILSIIPLIENYEKNKSINQILVTSSTLSSSNVLNKFKFKKTVHQFYPIDHAFCVSKFLKHWKPDMAIFIDSEIWPCMFKSLKTKKIPLILLNARITKKTFLKWKILSSFAKEVFNKIKIAYPNKNVNDLYTISEDYKDKVSGITHSQIIESLVGKSEKYGELVNTIQAPKITNPLRKFVQGTDRDTDITSDIETRFAAMDVEKDDSDIVDVDLSKIEV